MDLVYVAEDARTVTLSWTDCTLLALLLERALERDALHDADSFGLADGHARTVIALCEAGGHGDLGAHRRA